MLLITSDSQLRQFIPNIFATVEGEQPLIDKIAPFLDLAEQWATDTLTSEATFQRLAANTAPESGQPLLTRAVVNHAFLSAVPALDLVLTPNGFGIVSNQNVAPASKERVERLMASLEAERDHAIDALLRRLPFEEGWLETTQGRFFASTLFPTLSLCRRLAIRQHLWAEYEGHHARLTKIENILAETYFSHEQMQVFRQTVILQKGAHPLVEHVIRSLQSHILMLLSDMQVHPQSFYDLVNTIRQHEDIFPEWHASKVAALYTPTIFCNKKKSGGYWF